MASLQVGFAVAVLGATLLLTGCSLDGLADGKVSTGSSSSSTGTGMQGPPMFTWAHDIKATAPPAGAIKLAPFGDGAVVAVSGAAEFDLTGTLCGTASFQNLCLATANGSGSFTAFADGVGGDAPKIIASVATTSDAIAVAGTFGKGTITFGSAATPPSFTGGAQVRASFIALFDATTHLKGVGRLRSDPSGMAQAVVVRAVALDAMDNVYVTGSYRVSLFYTPPAGAEMPLPNLSTAVTADGFVMKLSPSLQPVWWMNLGGASSGEGHAIDANLTRVVVGGVGQKVSQLGAVVCGDGSPSATLATSSVAFEGVILPSGVPVSCYSFGAGGADVASVIATPAGALLGGVYQTAGLMWPVLPAPLTNERPAFVAELDLASPKAPLAQAISGDISVSKFLNGMAFVNGVLYTAGSSNGNADWKAPSPGACLQSFANSDGFVSAQTKALGAPFAIPRGGMIGSPGAETIDALAVTPSGGMIVAGTYENAFDLLPTPMSPGENFVGLVNPKFLTSPACP